MISPQKPPKWIERWPAAAQRLAAATLSVVIGMAAAVLLHYLLYRMGLPSRPFIYVAF